MLAIIAEAASGPVRVSVALWPPTIAAVIGIIG